MDLTVEQEAELRALLNSRDLSTLRPRLTSTPARPTAPTPTLNQAVTGALGAEQS